MFLGLHLCRARLCEPDVDGCSNLEWSDDARGWVTQCWKMTFQPNSNGETLLTFQSLN